MRVILRVAGWWASPMLDFLHKPGACRKKNYIVSILFLSVEVIWETAKNWDTDQICTGCSLAPLVKKVNEGRVVDIVESLCQRLLTGREQQRDIASIALKTVVAEISSGSVAQCVVVSLTPKLTKGITSSVRIIIVICVWSLTVTRSQPFMYAAENCMTSLRSLSWLRGFSRRQVSWQGDGWVRRQALR
jgi:hypothetical protein